MKIVFLKFPHNSELGGGELHTLSLARHFVEKKVSVQLLSSDDILLSEFRKQNIAAEKVWAPLEPVSMKALLLFPFTAPFFKVFLLYKLLLKKEKNTSIFCLSYTEKILITPLARMFGFRVLWMEHLDVNRSYSLNPFRFAYVMFSRLAVVVAVSKSVAEQLVQLGVAKKNIKVIYNGIDLALFKPSGNSRESKDLVVGMASRLNPEKKIQDAIRAFAKVHKKFPHSKLVIAGEGSERTRLEEIAAELGIEGAVVFKGFVKDMPAFLSKVDVFALVPHNRESFGLAAAEAQAMSVPVVATAVSGLREVVEHQKTGLLVDPGSVDQIAQSIEVLFANEALREKMGAAGRDRVRKIFTAQSMFDAFEKVLFGKSL